MRGYTGALTPGLIQLEKLDYRGSDMFFRIIIFWVQVRHLKSQKNEVAKWNTELTQK